LKKNGALQSTKYRRRDDISSHKKKGRKMGVEKRVEYTWKHRFSNNNKVV